MSTLSVTFTTAFPKPAREARAPLASGSAARSEDIVLPGTGTLSAMDGEDVVELSADADCWVAIGENPDPGAASDGVRAAHKLISGLPAQYAVSPGDTIAVEAA